MAEVLTGSSHWTVSARSSGEVLAVRVGQAGLQMGFVGSPRGLQAAEIQGWLGELIGMAAASTEAGPPAPQGAPALPIPRSLHQALTGLLFLQAEVWGEPGDRVPMTLVVVEHGDRVAFGWSGAGRVTLVRSGEQAEPAWTVVRDDHGREARALVADAARPLSVRGLWSANGPAGEPLEGVLEAEWPGRVREAAEADEAPWGRERGTSRPRPRRCPSRRPRRCPSRAVSPSRSPSRSAEAMPEPQAGRRRSRPARAPARSGTSGAGWTGWRRRRRSRRRPAVPDATPAPAPEPLAEEPAPLPPCELEPIAHDVPGVPDLIPQPELARGRAIEPAAPAETRRAEAAIEAEPAPGRRRVAPEAVAGAGRDAARARAPPRVARGRGAPTAGAPRVEAFLHRRRRRARPVRARLGARPRGHPGRRQGARQRARGHRARSGPLRRGGHQPPGRGVDHRGRRGPGATHAGHPDAQAGQARDRPLALGRGGLEPSRERQARRARHAQRRAVGRPSRRRAGRRRAAGGHGGRDAARLRAVRPRPRAARHPPAAVLRSRRDAVGADGRGPREPHRRGAGAAGRLAAHGRARGAGAPVRPGRLRAADRRRGAHRRAAPRRDAAAPRAAARPAQHPRELPRGGLAGAGRRAARRQPALRHARPGPRPRPAAAGGGAAGTRGARPAGRALGVAGPGARGRRARDVAARPHARGRLAALPDERDAGARRARGRGRLPDRPVRTRAAGRRGT